jgi:hypothetical protein
LSIIIHRFINVIQSVQDAIDQVSYCSILFPGHFTYTGTRLIRFLFLQNTKHEIVGVLSQENLRTLEPKWTKWTTQIKIYFLAALVRMYAKCRLYFRSWLLSLIENLVIYTCPRTEIVSLSSPSFCYSAIKWILLPYPTSSKKWNDFLWFIIILRIISTFPKGRATTFFRVTENSLRQMMRMILPLWSLVTQISSHLRLFQCNSKTNGRYKT